MKDDEAPPIAVIGGAVATREQARVAAEVGREISRRGGVVICGGRGGVMEHAARGAMENGGTSIGILPGRPGDAEPNPYLSFRIFTGLGQARNQVIVLSSAAAIAVGGEWGTLSEIALALKHRVPVVLLDSFDLKLPNGGDDPLLFRAPSAEEAVRVAFKQRRSLS